MKPYAKIATCNYCGAQTALELKGKVQHELSCGNCSAPLHLMKHVPLKPSARTAHDPRTGYTPHYEPRPKARKPKKQKKKKSFSRKLFSEAFDILDDLFD
jgi:hypothetical protein